MVEEMILLMLLEEVFYICSHVKITQWLLHNSVHSTCALLTHYTKKKKKSHGKLVLLVCEFSNCISDFKKERP